MAKKKEGSSWFGRWFGTGQQAPEKTLDPPKASQAERIEFLKKTRGQILRNLGLPEDTPPEDVTRLLEAKSSIERIGRMMEKTGPSKK